MISAGPAHVARINGVALLRAAQVPHATHDAGALLAWILQTELGLLPMAADLDRCTAQRYAKVIDRRAQREPLQHIIGTAWFAGLPIAVGPGVFIPRPETELLVDWVLHALLTHAPVVHDLCAGSGAIALAIKAARPDARVYAIENDPEALRWLRRNVQQLQLDVSVIEADATDARWVRQLPRADAITCNPPYVPNDLELEPEVSRFDPAAALWGGVDGLDIVREIVPILHRAMHVHSVVAIEHHDDHQDDLLDLLRSARLGDVEGHRDLAGRSRFVTAVCAYDWTL